MSDGDARPPAGDGPPAPRRGRALPTPGLNPDQSCFGCLILLGMIVASLVFWGWIYWRNNPEFHTP